MIIIDRFEGDFAACEYDGEMVNIPKIKIVPGAHEGDVLLFCEGQYIIDRDETDKRKKRAKALFKKFRNS